MIITYLIMVVLLTFVRDDRNSLFCGISMEETGLGVKGNVTAGFCGGDKGPLLWGRTAAWDGDLVGLYKLNK